MISDIFIPISNSFLTGNYSHSIQLIKKNERIKFRQQSLIFKKYLTQKRNGEIFDFQSSLNIE